MKYIAYGMGIQLFFLRLLDIVDIKHGTSVPVMGLLKLAFYCIAVFDFILIPIFGLFALGVIISDKKDTSNFAALIAGLLLGLMAHFTIEFLFKVMF